MTTGRETLSQIEQALTDLRAQEARVQREVDEATRERAGLAADRLAALRDLALTRVAEAMADGVVSEADRLSDQVRMQLDARQRTMAQLKERHQAAEQERVVLVKRHDEQTKAIDQLEERLDRLSDQAQVALGSDPAYRDLAQAHAALTTIHGKAQAKAEEAKRTEMEKGAAYRNDPLFMYLWRRQYGSSDYKAHPLFAWLDSKVASLVRYGDARANFAVLTEIPVRLQAHAGALAAQVASMRKDLDTREAARIKQMAGEDLPAKLAAARAEQQEQLKQLEALTAELQETGNQLRLYAEGQDQSYQNAVKLYMGFLEQENARTLVAEAKATPTPTDDKIVERVLDIGARMEALEAAIGGEKKKLDALFQRKQELTRISTNFRRQHFDDAGSVIEGVNTQELLMLLLRGAITAAEYWARTQSNQRWRSRPADPWRRSSGLPPLGDIFIGSSSGGGGRRSSGGSDGGFRGKDFRTGGSF